MSLRERIAGAIASADSEDGQVTYGQMADAVLAELGPELGRNPVEMEWCWVDQAGRQMTNWNRDTPPPLQFRKASDEKGTMRVEVRVVTTPQPQASAEDDRILWGVVANAGRLSSEQKPRWAHVSDATGLGSTKAAELCLRFDRDPEALLGGRASLGVGRE